MENTINVGMGLKMIKEVIINGVRFHPEEKDEKGEKTFKVPKK
jgi:hypothetical protein